MSLPENLGRLSAALTSDASLNIGVGVTPSGSFKLEVGTTSKFTGVATFGSTLSNGTYSYTLPSATGTLALVGGAGVGTVTSVAAITLGTSGTDLSSTVATGTTTPVITLNVPDASAANRGVVTTGAQTFAGAKTLNSALAGTSASFSSELNLGGTLYNSASDKTTGINLKQAGNTSANGIYLERTGERTGYYIYVGGGLDALTFQRNYAGTKSDVLALNRDGTITASGAATFSSSVTINAAGKLTVNRSDNTRYGEFYADNTAVHLTSSTDPIRISSADRTEFYNVGSERMRITLGGNVGIGTTSPAYKLDVYSATSPATIGLKTDSLYNSVIRDYIVSTDTYLDITTERTDGGGFNFLLLVSSTLVASGSHRNYYTFAVAGRGTTATATQLSNVTAGTSSRTAIAVSFPSNGVIRLTLTGAETCQIKVTAMGHGSL